MEIVPILGQRPTMGDQQNLERQSLCCPKKTNQDDTSAASWLLEGLIFIRSYIKSPISKVVVLPLFYISICELKPGCPKSPARVQGQGEIWERLQGAARMWRGCLGGTSSNCHCGFSSTLHVFTALLDVGRTLGYQVGSALISTLKEYKRWSKILFMP